MECHNISDILKNFGYITKEYHDISRCEIFIHKYIVEKYGNCFDNYYFKIFDELIKKPKLYTKYVNIFFDCDNLEELCDDNYNYHEIIDVGRETNNVDNYYNDYFCITNDDKIHHIHVTEKYDSYKDHDFYERSEYIFESNGKINYSCASSSINSSHSHDGIGARVSRFYDFENETCLCNDECECKTEYEYINFDDFNIEYEKNEITEKLDSLVPKNICIAHYDYMYKLLITGPDITTIKCNQENIILPEINIINKLENLSDDEIFEIFKFIIPKWFYKLKYFGAKKNDELDLKKLLKKLKKKNKKLFEEIYLFSMKKLCVLFETDVKTLKNFDKYDIILQSIIKLLLNN